MIAIENLFHSLVVCNLGNAYVVGLSSVDRDFNIGM